MADIPTAFDWISLVVVPALLGLGSLAVAYASWLVARASHALATKLDRRDEAAQRREDRYRVAESVTLAVRPAEVLSAYSVADAS